MPILGLGIDLVDARRVERLISRSEDIFRSRILGHSERSQISMTASKPGRCLSYARSIAAKEAFLKALGTGLVRGMRWSDIEVVHNPVPSLAICGEAASIVERLQADTIHLSFSAPRKTVAAHVQAIVILAREHSL